VTTPPHGRPVAGSGAQTADRIRAAATDLFCGKGFVATTVREIAHACGLTPGAIYNHFGSKDEILYSIVDRSLDEDARAVAAALANAAGGPSDQLRAAVDAFMERHLAFPESARVTDRDHVFLRGPRLDEIVTRRRAMQAVLERLIDAGIAAGEMRVPRVGQGLGTELVAMSLIDLSVAVSEWHRLAQRLPAGAVRAFQTDLALQLVGAAPDRGH
jgi:AcrR family transcriptional regulator